MRTFVLTIVSISLAAQTKTPKIWDDKALEDWATPIAALGVRPGHYTSAEYYAAPADNLKTYPVYRPDREPAGYWEWLHKQKPQPLVDVSRIHTREDWMKTGEVAFQALDEVWSRRGDAEAIGAARNLAGYDGVWTMQDGTVPRLRWVVTASGVQLGFVACAACHRQLHADGTVVWGAPLGAPPPGSRRFTPTLPPSFAGPPPPFLDDPNRIAFWRMSTVPWAPDPRIEKIRDMTDAAFAAVRADFGPIAPQNVISRVHGSPFSMTKIPDLNNVRVSRYIDATGTHRLRGPEDIARYAAFVSGADPMDFGGYKILTPEQHRVTFRYGDEVLYALAVYLMSLEPPKNRDVAPSSLVARGGEIFRRETCISCHLPPDYTNGKLTLAQGYTPPPDHPNRSDVMNTSVGTDAGLAMKTRKGTGFYKVPSLRGLWYRPVLLHDGSVASLEEMFDAGRLKPDHMPGGWKGPGGTNGAIPGHPFGLALNVEDKKALLAFLRSL